MAKKTKGDKFPLLVYRRWARMLRWSSFFIFLISAAALWFDLDASLISGRVWLFYIAAGVGLLIFVYSVYAYRASYVQCFTNYVRIRTPFLAVAVSYKRVLQVRPVDFHTQLPAKLRSPQMRLLEPYLGRTVILLELSAFPVKESRLRRWLPWYMFARDVTGFVLVVEDWMALSRQIGGFSDRWIARHRTRPRPIFGQTHY
jgi:hypothetical protein